MKKFKKGLDSYTQLAYNNNRKGNRKNKDLYGKDSKMTKYEKLKSFTLEEVAECLFNMDSGCEWCMRYHNNDTCYIERSNIRERKAHCINGICEWLESEAE